MKSMTQKELMQAMMIPVLIQFMSDITQLAYIEQLKENRRIVDFDLLIPAMNNATRKLLELVEGK
jgi:hypothetical protein